MRNPTLRITRRLIVSMLSIATLATSATAAARTLTDPIPAGATRTHFVNVGLYDNYLTVEGDGRTGSDLDCWLYQDGVLLDFDDDASDYCVLATPGTGTHRLVITNVARRTNHYTITQLW
jgi:hypothetical protein